MADVSSIRHPLAETTNRVNSAIQAYEQHSRKVRPDHGSRAASQAGNEPRRASQPTRPPSAMDHYATPTASRSPGPTTPPIEEELEDKRLSQVSHDSTSSNRSRKSYKTHIGPWQLGKTLGKGSSARVRLCRHNITGQLAAVKIVNRRMAYLVQDSSLAALSKEDTSIPDQMNGEMRVPMAIEREVAILKLIEHPHIMKLYDIWENRSEIYLILEFIDQGDLFTFINSRGRLKEEVSIYFFRQMLSAMTYCHSFNICHRDLKPENILITNDMQIKIADFGMAALHQTSTHQLVTACGSPHYAAPELLKNKQYKGDKADIWSLGVILFAMLSATLPFDDPDLRVMMSKTKLGQYKMPKFLSPNAQDLIRRMLQTNPDKRISLQEIWKHPLIQHYSYVDNFGEANGLPPDIRKGFQFNPVPKHEIDPQLVRQLRSMWHMFSEHDLALKLSCEEPNDQKAFYWLLCHYREQQLEDFKPELVHSMSDYHHLKPNVWKKRVSTRQFAQTGLNGSGRSISRFTVISNAAETDTGTVQSYDPYRGSRVMQPCSSQVNQTRIVVHRDSVRTASSQGTKVRGASGTHRGRPPSAGHNRPPSSRGSMSSLRTSRQGTPHAKVPALRHKRGVEFAHSRNRSASASRAQRSSSRMSSSSALNAPANRKSRSESPSMPPTAGGKNAKAERTSTLKAPRHTSSLLNEELRQFSSTIAKDCDEAFKSSLIQDASIAGSLSDVENIHRKVSPLSFSKDGTPEIVTAQQITARYYETRPLPPLPADSPISPLTSTCVSYTTSDLRDEVDSIDVSTEEAQRMALPAVVVKSSDRRVVSAPATSNVVKRPTVLPAINENAGLNNAAIEKSRIVSAPPHTPPKKNDGVHHGVEYLSQVENSIRVVHSPSESNITQVPAPLNVRKTSAPAEMETVHPVVSKPETEVSSLAQETQDGATKRKKLSWFRRVSRTDSEAESAFSATSNATSPTTPCDPSRPEEAHSDGPFKKKVFSFPFWKKGNDSKMSIPEEGETGNGKAVQASALGGQGPPSRWQASNSGEIRHIEVKQNWLARLFRVKPATRYVCLTMSRKQARQETVSLLKEWRKYGIKGIQVDKKRNIVFARVAPKNSLHLKEVAFAAEIITVIEHGKKQPLSIIRFTQERGAASSFHQVIDTTKVVFKSRNLVVTDKNKRKMMIKTLNS